MTDYDDDNIFAKILRREIERYEIYSNRHCIAILDVFPEQDGHVLVIPKTRAVDITDVDEETLQELIKVVRLVARWAQKACGAQGSKVVVRNGAAAGQEIGHLHFHVIPAYAGLQGKNFTGNKNSTGNKNLTGNKNSTGKMMERHLLEQYRDRYIAVRDEA